MFCLKKQGGWPFELSFFNNIKVSVSLQNCTSEYLQHLELGKSIFHFNWKAILFHYICFTQDEDNANFK